MSTHLPYRPCVGIALFNHDGKVFVGERLSTPNAWQMPQGGIDDGEDIFTAAKRELFEETGISQIELLEISTPPIAYDLPSDLQQRLWNGQFRGQEQTWVAMRFTGSDSDIDLNAHEQAEFSRWQWVHLHDTIGLIVPFKMDVYREVIRRFGKFSGTNQFQNTAINHQ